jgi:hypothetical protein
LALALLAVAGCASVPRVPFTKEQQAAAVIPDIPNARVWSDERAEALLARARSEVFGPRRAAPSMCWRSRRRFQRRLWAGLLAGWSERGTRPNSRS